MSSPRRPTGPRWVPTGAVGLLVGRRRNAAGVDSRRLPLGHDNGSDEPVESDPNAHLAHPEPVDPDLLDADVEHGIEDARRTRPAWLRLPVLAAVAAGGVLGAPARYELALALPARSGTFPLSTFVINVTGSFVLGALLTLIVEKWPPTDYLRPFAATGVLGAYTTWSTFMVDTDMLLKAGHVLLAVGYVAATLSAGLAAVYVGILLVRTWPPPLLGRRSRRGDDDGSDRDG